MKIAYVHPQFPDTLWSFRGIRPITGVKTAFAPLGLATAVALTPEDWEIEIYDEEIEPINFAIDADLIALTAFNVQAKRAYDIAAEFQKRGKHVALGGPYASLCPDNVRPHVDTVISGESEYIWPEFLNDFKNGRHKDFYQQEDKVSMADSPLPAFEKLDATAYQAFYVQTTRGCPFDCEFCDIIITDGRIPRVKSIEQVMAEVDKLRQLNVKYVTFSDANYIANTKFAKDLTHELIRFSKKYDYPISFACEATLNLANKDELLGLMQAANFETIFIGIESPRKSSLLETNKRQNTHGSIVADVHKIQSYNMAVIAGMIVGFDNDDKHIFQEQFDFLMEAGIPFTTSGVLVAIEKTPLYYRMQREGRLLKYNYEEQKAHGAADLNFVPKLMSREELLKGYNWLIRALYSYDYYSKRLITALQNFTPGLTTFRQNNPFMTKKTPQILWNIAKHFVFTKDHERRQFFFTTLRESLRGHFSVRKFVEATSFMTLHKHFHEYITKTHGNPETAGPISPFCQETIEEHPDASLKMVDREQAEEVDAEGVTTT
ncbi:B12-binding domain-containing radical SAM protein [candidate division KSB1 bacterium]|nr:B12-binding domain-containing radical SAM protein [candidate division KSB1 bacterium]NIR69539.1 B12-binding domain-containing radical SAM protein [candidate division KSB1 bacterium]NIS22849.1 B12-binding domain-containing radical SAM protein [candidate division KSB1 bacterium]NIT69685.1 B12-binding domain-containing radical SAM protein [candidate division KSB1 bacterium]NIU23355.1 B12-binding domain-containing radical SAM protein [candidate division KSB1 bacterium]